MLTIKKIKRKELNGSLFLGMHSRGSVPKLWCSTWGDLWAVAALLLTRKVINQIKSLFSEKKIECLFYLWQLSSVINSADKTSNFRSFK